MISLLTISKAQKLLGNHLRDKRLIYGYTQKGLADRSGVRLPTLRKFEQQGVISLESLLKLLTVLDGLEDLEKALKPKEESFFTAEDIVAKQKRKKRKYGWRK